MLLWPLGAALAQPSLVEHIAHLQPKVLPRSSADSLFRVLKSRYNRALEAKDGATAAASLQQLGQVCYHQGHYPQAFDFYRKAGDLYCKLGRNNQLAANYNDLGSLYYASKQPAAARQQHKQALALYKRAANQTGLAATYGQLGHLCEKQHRYDSTFYYQHLALQLYQQLDSKRGKAKILENVGSIFEDIGQYDSARVYFQQASLLSQQAHAEVGQVEVLNNLGDVLRKTGHYQAGLRATRQALALARKTGEHHQVGGAYSDLAKTVSSLNQNDSAYYYSAWSRKYEAATYSANNSQQLTFLQTLYDLARKDQEIARLNNAHFVNRLLVAAAAGVGLLLLLLGSVIINRQWLKLRSEQALSEQNRRVYDTQRELLQVELKNKQLEEESLKLALAMKDRELTTNTLHVIQKNQLLEELRGQLDGLVKDDRRDQKRQLKQLLNQIGQNFNHDQHWQDFRTTYEQMN